MNVKLTKKASRDLDKIASYYDSQDEGRGKKFMFDVNDSIGKIKLMPNGFRAGLKPDTRQKVMHKYPYIISYKVVDSEIIIITVYHQKKKMP